MRSVMHACRKSTYPDVERTLPRPSISTLPTFHRSPVFLIKEEIDASKSPQHAAKFQTRLK